MLKNFIGLLAVLTACSTASRQAPQEPAPAGETAAETAEAAEAAVATGSDMAPALLAATRITAVEPVPSEVRVTRGDTIDFRAVFRDERGNPVTGARWGVTDQANVFQVRSIKDSIPDSYLLWGVGPGEARLGIWLQVPADTGYQWRQLAQVPVHVEEWAADRIEVEPLSHAPYAGSMFALSGRVMTTHDTEHASAAIRWSSDDPEVVSVTPAGVATFHHPGRAQIRARAEEVTASHEIEVLADPIAEIAVRASARDVRMGDVVRLEAELRDERGDPVEDAHVAYAVTAIQGPDNGAVAYADGAFVASAPGVYRIVATAGGRTASTVISAGPRAASRDVKLIGRGSVSHVTTSDLWVFEGRNGRDYAYTGTHAEGGGQRMFVWDVTEPSDPILTDSVVVDARVVNDVKVNEDATVAVITREGASNRRNGIVLLDIADPAHPEILSEFSDSLTAGVHNTWIHGHVVYAINNGTRAMHIVDISDPAAPRHIGRYEFRPGEEDKYLHDVWAEDGFAYLSYWDDGLVILDVGAGIKGGTPTEPVFVSRYKYPIGNTHTAYRYGDYVFVGDEIFGCSECVNGPRGYIHVIDVRDIEDPKEVARYEVPEAGAHNIWVEDDRLYIAYYQGGLRVVDVSGELRGDLYEQGRQIGWYHTVAPEGEAIHPNAPMAWGPQPYKGYIFVSDMHSGLWVVQLEPGQALVP